MSSLISHKENMLKLYNNPEYSDFEIRIGKRCFLVQKCILACNSDYFKALLYGNFNQDKNLLVLSEEEYNPEAFDIVLRFFYTGTSKELEMILEKGMSLLFTISETGDKHNFVDKILEVLKLSEMFDLHHLQTRCMELLIKMNRFSFGMTILEYVYNREGSPNMKRLKELAVQKITTEFDIYGKLWENLSFPVILYLLNLDGICQTEDIVTKILLLWLKKHPDTSLSEKEQLKKVIRKHSLSKEFIKELSQINSLFSAEELLEVFLTEKKEKPRCVWHPKGRTITINNKNIKKVSISLGTSTINISKKYCRESPGEIFLLFTSDPKEEKYLQQISVNEIKVGKHRTKDIIGCSLNSKVKSFKILFPNK